MVGNLAYAYDIELLPIVWNQGSGIFFSAVFSNDEDCIVFEISPRKDQTSELLKFLENRPFLYGYNNHNYDDKVLDFLINLFEDDKFNLQTLLKFSKNLIEKEDREKCSFSKNTVDLMTLTFQHKAQKSLKMVGVILEHPVLSESKVDFLTGLGLEKESLDYVCDHLIGYNINDVEITKKLWKLNKSKLELRQSMLEMYPGYDLLSSYDSELAKVVVLNEYNKRAGFDASNLRTNRKEVKVKDIIPETIRFQDNEKYLELLKIMDSWCVDFTKEDKTFFEVKSKMVSHTIATGGIHSVAPPKLYRKGDFEILDADFGSYYPYLMLNFEIYPEHLDKDIFLGILREMTEKRIELKRLSKTEKDPVKLKSYSLQADRLKISINSIYGLLGSETFFLFDQKARLKVCIVGQLLIMYMIYKIEELFPDSYCIYSNTDGFTFLTKQKEEVKSWAENFTKSLNFLLEFDEFEFAAIRDVNNYLIKKTDGKIKRKGDYEHEPNVLQGYNFPVISLAAEKYLVENHPIDKFINSYDNVYKYCSSRKFDKNSTLVWTRVENGEVVEEILPKTIRWFICNKNSKIRKKDLYQGKERVIDISSGYNAYPLFDVKGERFDINKSWYIKEAKKLVDVFNSNSLF